MACLGQRCLRQWAEHVLDIRLLLKRGGPPIRGTPPKPEGISRLTEEEIREFIRLIQEYNMDMTLGTTEIEYYYRQIVNRVDG